MGETAMTRRAWKPCGRPGCAALVRNRRYCRDHDRQDDQARGTSTQRGYDKAWREFRDAHIGARCERCEVDRDDSDWPLELHHIDGLGPQGPRGRDPENLETLCKPCHTAETRGGAHR